MNSSKQHFRFKKEERLCSKKIFEELAVGKNSFFSHPIKLIWLQKETLPDDALVQAAFTVPKRLFKKAVDRNRIKRIMREAYRLNKHYLYEDCIAKNKRLALLFVYVAKDSPNFNLMQEKLLLLLQRLMKNGHKQNHSAN
ncbi:MAG: ribonuclease P protein component [Bacteroidia bacterium]